MSLRCWITCCAVVALGSAAIAQEQVDDRRSPASHLSFLELDRDYLIRFAQGSDLFRTTKSGVTSTTYRTEDGKESQGSPATWTFTLEISIFELKRLGGGSWALLRHPENTDDTAKWLGMRRAKAILASDRVEEIEQQPDGAEKLARLREAADRDIDTTETWVNLNHAVLIADVPTDEAQFTWNVKSIQTEPKK